MPRRLRGLRRCSQITFLVAFLLLFAFAAYPLKTPVPADLFLRADPLLALSAMVSLRRLILPLLWYALPVVVLSLLLGRVYCGWVCPMGTTIDLCERLFHIRGFDSAQPRPTPSGVEGRGSSPSQKPRWSRLKFYLLIALVATMLVPAGHRAQEELALSQSVGLSAVYIADPIALLTRTLTWTALPAAQYAAELSRDTAMAWGQSGFVQRHPTLARALSPLQIGLHRVVRPAHFRLGVVSFALFALVVALGRYAPRFWCRNLCPLGALLGWLGKASPLRLAVSDKCTRCLKCVNECKMGAISDDPHHYCGPECTACFTCLAVCPEGAISLTTGREHTGREDEFRLDRRRVLQALGLGMAAVVLPKMDWRSARSSATQKVLKISSQRLIRPPGAFAEDEFVTACVRCAECMKACPTNALQPAFGEGGLEALGTPILVPRIGPCTQACNLCGRVCPTGALAPFSIEEKAYLHLGTARVDRSICLAWAGGRRCLVCQEACPYQAIRQSADMAAGIGRPVVDEGICVGCGTCEWVCPVEPLGAIRVSSGGDRRHLTRDAQRALRQEPEQEVEGASPYPLR